MVATAWADGEATETTQTASATTARAIHDRHAGGEASTPAVYNTGAGEWLEGPRTAAPMYDAATSSCAMTATAPVDDPKLRSRLAYKAYEIEELVDVYVFRRLGIVVAHAARVAGLSPNAVSVVAGLVGMVGGALLSSARWAPLGVVLIYLHGVVDSADGQLARMTGQVSELGRVLDGVAGYLTHIAVYVSIVVVVVGRDGSWWVVPIAAVAGACTAVQAQMYDYHRTAYASIVLKRRVPTTEGLRLVSGWLGDLVTFYVTSQRRLLGLHVDVEHAIARRAVDGTVRDADARGYRTCFYRPVRGWNLMGDNIRRYAIAGCVAFHHIEWFLVLTLVPLNLVLMALWLWQRRADRRYLQAIGPVPGGDVSG